MRFSGDLQKIGADKRALLRECQRPPIASELQINQSLLRSSVSGYSERKARQGRAHHIPSCVVSAQELVLSVLMRPPLSVTAFNRLQEGRVTKEVKLKKGCSCNLAQICLYTIFIIFTSGP